MNQRFTIPTLLFLMGVVVLLSIKGSQGQETQAKWGSNPAVRILQAYQDGRNIKVSAQRAGPSVLLSGAWYRSQGQTRELKQIGCTDLICTWTTENKQNSPGQVSVCANSDILPDQDFCSSKAVQARVPEDGVKRSLR